MRSDWSLLKWNDNKDVWVYLGLKSKPSVKAPLQFATGNGWKYTMIKPSKDEFTYTGYGYLSFSFDFAPKESPDETLDYNAFELDPDCAPAGYFAFPSGYQWGGWPIFVSSKCKPGEYTLVFRMKSNHDVKCSMKFTITPEQ